MHSISLKMQLQLMALLTKYLDYTQKTQELQQLQLQLLMVLTQLQQQKKLHMLNLLNIKQLQLVKLLKLLITQKSQLKVLLLVVTQIKMDSSYQMHLVSFQYFLQMVKQHVTNYQLVIKLLLKVNVLHIRNLQMVTILVKYKLNQLKF